MSETNPLISVIVPVYKVEPYIRQCLDSIINQTYGNLEIILVDDGSPDNCPAICDEYAAKDNRVKVIHKPNGGVSSARNAGLDVVSGDYIGFIDSDDFVKPEYYSHLLATIQTNNADFAICEGIAYKSNSDFTPWVMDNSTDVISPSDFFNSVLFNTQGQYRFELGGVVLWNKLFKRYCWDDIRFDESIVAGEDFWAVVQIADKSSVIALCKEPLYYYRMGSTGLMSTTTYLHHSRIAFMLSQRIVKLFEVQNELYLLGIEHLIATCFILLNYSAAYNSRSDFNSARIELLSYSKQINQIRNTFSLKYRFGLFLLFYLPNSFWLINKIRNKK